MIIRFFKSNQQATFFAIPILAIVLWMVGFLHSIPMTTNFPMPIYKLIMVFYAVKTDLAYRILGFGILILQSIYLNNIINKHEVLYRRSHLPALFYCVLMSLYIPLLNLHPVLLVNMLLILLLDKILSLYKSTSNFIAFDCGLIIGVCALIYFPSFILFLLVLIALVILRPFYWRNWIVAILGMTVPFYFITIYYFWIGNLRKFYAHDLPQYFIHYLRFDFSFPRPMKVLAMLTGIVLLLSLLKLQSNFFKNAIRTRNYQIVLLIFFLLTIASLLLSPAMRLEDFSLIAIPASIFISYYFLSTKRTIFSEVIMLLLLFLIIYNQIVFKS